MDSASSVRSVHSTHSNTTVKGSTSHNEPTSSSTAFPYTVGRLSTFHDTDMDMDDPFAIPPTQSHHHHARHRIDSQGVPIPPARTTSLGHHTHSHSHTHSVSSSDTSLPSVQVTTATPTKRQNNSSHPYQDQAPQYGQYGNSLGHGSLDITEDHQGYTFPQYSSSTDQLNSYTSVEDDSDLDPEFRQAAMISEQEDKVERARRQGRDRQRRKRAKDKEEKKKLQAHPAGLIVSTPTPTPSGPISRNPSITSLAPIIVPNFNMSMSTIPIGPPSSGSSVYSSLPTSASFLSLSPNTQTNTQSTSGASSPTTFFSPMTPATNPIAQDGYPWSSHNNSRASKSAVDVRTTQLSRSNTNTNFHSSNRPRAIAPPPHRVPLASSSTSSHSAKRRRSEPEPDHFKTKEVGLGVMNMPQQSQGDGPIEFLSTPSDETGHGYASNINKPKERPGMRRTASDSAATALEFSTHSHSHQSRSPTPPLLESLKSTHLPLAPSLQAQSQAGLLASVALSALVDSPLEDIQRALAELKLTREGLMALQPELTSFFGRFCLEQEMSAVSLDDRPSTSYQGFSSHTTPYNEHIPLSNTSTQPPSPTFRMDPPPKVQTTTTTTKATPKTNRARSLSSASMRARGLKMSSTTNTNTNTNTTNANANVNTNNNKSPALSLFQETLISPMSTASYQFPNTPITAMPDSDDISGSPMMSAVQTPTTGQSAFPHHEILAIGQGAMRLDEGRVRQNGSGDGAGVGGYQHQNQHQRSATEGGNKGWGHAQGHGHGGGGGHGRSGSEWNIQQAAHQHRPSSSYSQGLSNSQSFSGLSSPLDMPNYRHQPGGQGPIAPPPHLPPPAFDFTYPQHQHQHHQSPTVHQQQQQQHQQQTFQTPSHRHHQSQSSGLSTPYTPSPAGHHPHNHVHGHGHGSGSGHGHTGGIYQPTFTPIAEIGTPTRPSPREPRMLAYDPNNANSTMGMGMGMGRMEEMDQMVLSPPPHSNQGGMMPEGNWMTFGQVMPHTNPGTDAEGFGGDPFGTGGGTGTSHQQR